MQIQMIASKDLTRCTQARLALGTTTSNNTSTNLFDSADPSFFWNKSMLEPLLSMRANELSPPQRKSLDNSNMLIQAIQGFIGTVSIPSSSSSSSPLKLSLISRLGCKNAGTRFNARGINDEGHVSNFVETEMVLEAVGRGYLASFLLLRGSVAVFWEQTGVQFAGHRVDLSRGFEVTQGAFGRHFGMLQEQYGHIHVVNLLSGKEGSAEKVLVDEYKKHIDTYKGSDQILYTHFDYHGVVKSGGHERANAVLDFIQGSLDKWSYTLVETKPDTYQPVFTQQGVLRVNCLDCLDRTNHVEFIAAKMMAETCLRQMGLEALLQNPEGPFADAFQNLWADNGDWLSKIYTGTGALKTSLTRRGKQTVMGFFDDAAKSVSRFYINNFQDKHRQEAIDIVLGKQRVKSLLIPNSLSVIVEHDLSARKAEFCSFEDIDVFIGTWNVNGKTPGSDPIGDWLHSRVATQQPNLVIIGIQELIELTAQQFVQADFEDLRSKWQDALFNTLNQQSSYVLLRSLNLMALGMFAYVRRDCVEKVRFVEISTIKTGLGGLGANKGGIGLSLQYQDTSMLFITAHMAAGQNSVEERNRDYDTIRNGLVFKRKAVKEHDMRFWLGDFNYRVDLPNEEARHYLALGDFGPLRAHDQLLVSQASGRCFDGYKEHPITFPPTYKYDNNTATYDTSEKARCPSWTDRILFAGKDLKALEYTHTDSLLMSDHRPVRAIFKARVEIIDLDARATIKDAISKAATPLIHHIDDNNDNSNGISSNSRPLPRSASSKSVGFQNEPEVHTISPLLDSQPLIDFSSDGQVWESLAVKIPAPQTNVVQPSRVGAAVQWWEVPVDETWLVDEGDSTNPFLGAGRL
ncbi:UNVERIFIED_CONTAM: inositol polyphosphate 5-phosphatase [Siphonaria sp. JEL0065]|nr:inositol polyphosphate 5-phosphatase [Siphonaria sp. JEL0065]